jgi:hypothetical protein
MEPNQHFIRRNYAATSAAGVAGEGCCRVIAPNYIGLSRRCKGLTLSTIVPMRSVF